MKVGFDHNIPNIHDVNLFFLSNGLHYFAWHKLRKVTHETRNPCPSSMIIVPLLVPILVQAPTEFKCRLARGHRCRLIGTHSAEYRPGAKRSSVGNPPILPGRPRLPQGCPHADINTQRAIVSQQNCPQAPFQRFQVLPFGAA